MSLSRIRNRIEALERKFAVPLAVVRLRPLAEKVCDEWAAAKAADKPLPKAQALIKRIADQRRPSHDFRLPGPVLPRMSRRRQIPQAKGYRHRPLPPRREKGRHLLHIRLGLRRPG